MAQFACKCGHRISDTTDGLPHKAALLPDAHSEEFFGGIADAAEALVHAVLGGSRDTWIKQRFLKDYPRDLSHSGIFSDFVLSLQLKYQRTCYECEACGRLWLETGPQLNEYISFAPESGRHEGILSAKGKR